MTQSQARFCSSCFYWQPLESIPCLGECENSSSRSFKRPTFSDKPVEECFVTRSLDDVEFVWCQTHRQTIHSSELPDHRDCRLFAGTALLPVEDMVEFTLAGD
jgi:hypothetical protein